ncbi:MAG: hypothetical protein JXA44_10890 [Methanospirillaceae archaeon]|nr:hypothetical protein [Methanospirillaceae archaeon]
MIFVFDSSPLIYLARTGALHLITKIPAELTLPPMVYDEVVIKGRESGYPDAEIVDQFIKNEVFSIVVPDIDKIIKYDGLKRDLHKGEIEVLALADQLRGTAIIDDRIAREIGEMFQVETRGSFFILFYLTSKKEISKDKAISIVNKMISEGFRIGILQYTEIIRLISQIH